ncbi:conserved hypothetical protein [Neospora caninum Liverpool]|uniref:Uncharacterized protein n=1 Tax=Neospora caninum (strain Liverpool) TaxID=572307 RepID=F0V802_NEOCL|nr:conserved hypothetical protein [Neospora caninum Liverpool]CBZ49843.1 conserved hypothetical protein [Neospora caninum Liverpool]CEL64432.1 TPA: hypothetical protein BN1204_003290 [Neospora caninum Liverpool]|eukprot:XP_003879878.1 conserved hypothetical protein [Neospora caninum Liverpool]
MQLPLFFSRRSLTVATFCGLLWSGVSPDPVEGGPHGSGVLSKLRPPSFSLIASPLSEGSHKNTTYPSGIKTVSRDEFLRLFVETFQREFKAEEGGLPGLFMEVAFEPALNRSASVNSLKKQMRAFADLMGVDGLSSEDERLKTILEVFSSYPVTQQGQSA